MLTKPPCAAFLGTMTAALLAHAAQGTPATSITVGSATGLGLINTRMPIQLAIRVDPASGPVDGITLNFSATDKTLQLISFSKGSALAGWVDLNPFDSADGIVSLGTFGKGITGTVTLGTLVVKPTEAGSHTIRLNGGRGSPTAVLVGITMVNPTVQARTITVTKTTVTKTPDSSPKDPAPDRSGDAAPSRASPGPLPFCGTGALGAMPALLIGMLALRWTQKRAGPLYIDQMR